MDNRMKYRIDISSINDEGTDNYHYVMCPKCNNIYNIHVVDHVKVTAVIDFGMDEVEPIIDNGIYKKVYAVRCKKCGIICKEYDRDMIKINSVLRKNPECVLAVSTKRDNFIHTMSDIRNGHSMPIVLFNASPKMVNVIKSIIEEQGFESIRFTASKHNNNANVFDCCLALFYKYPSETYTIKKFKRINNIEDDNVVLDTILNFYIEINKLADELDKLKEN